MCPRGVVGFGAGKALAFGQANCVGGRGIKGFVEAVAGRYAACGQQPFGLFDGVEFVRGFNRDRKGFRQAVNLCNIEQPEGFAHREKTGLAALFAVALVGFAGLARLHLEEASHRALLALADIRADRHVVG